LFPLFQQRLAITVQDVENPEPNLMITQFISKTRQFPAYRFAFIVVTGQNAHDSC
jgi:hypothetical protein